MDTNVWKNYGLIPKETMVFRGQTKSINDFLRELTDDQYLALCKDYVTGEYSETTRQIVEKISHFAKHGGDVGLFTMGEISIVNIYHVFVHTLCRKILSTSPSTLLKMKNYL